MTTLFVVVPLALLVSGLAVFAFVWSVKHGQMDDLSTPALRMLEEDDSSASDPGPRSPQSSAASHSASPESAS
jgi:cbb3-type cytochrome oxidase maturation protein